MKAIICKKYGPPEVLQIEEVPKPIPKDSQIVVKIVATTVNSGDVRVRALRVEGFMKIVMRLVLGFSKPRKPVLGTVFAGIVESAGNKVTHFKIGDRVFGATGFKFGTYAEYIAVDEKSAVVMMPHNASFDEAAAIVFGGQTAVYFLEKAGISKRVGLKILIIGGTGAVGSAAIQIAKYHGAEITTVCSSLGLPLVRSLGTTHTILYDKEDFTKQTNTFDIVFDAVGKTSKKQCAHLLNEGGVYITVEGFDVASDSKTQLEQLKRLYEDGTYQAVIDRTFTMNEIVEAHRYVDTGRKKGNVVLQISK
jgi:NADPH:quinone reductase-like Zn-dependent oxidoreductase